MHVDKLRAEPQQAQYYVQIEPHQTQWTMQEKCEMYFILQNDKAGSLFSGISITYSLHVMLVTNQCKTQPLFPNYLKLKVLGIKY